MRIKNPLFEIDPKFKVITNPKRIMQLALNKKSVYHKYWPRPTPAAFIQSMQFRTVLQMIDAKLLFERVKGGDTK